MKTIYRIFFGLEGILISLFTYFNYNIPNLIETNVMKHQYLTSGIIISAFGMEFAATAIGFLIIYCMAGAFLTIGFAELYMYFSRKFNNKNKLYTALRRVKYGIFYDEEKDIVLTVDEKVKQHESI